MGLILFQNFIQNETENSMAMAEPRETDGSHQHGLREAGACVGNAQKFLDDGIFSVSVAHHGTEPGQADMGL